MDQQALLTVEQVVGVIEELVKGALSVKEAKTEITVVLRPPRYGITLSTQADKLKVTSTADRRGRAKEIRWR